MRVGPISGTQPGWRAAWSIEKRTSNTAGFSTCHELLGGVQVKHYLFVGCHDDNEHQHCDLSLRNNWTYAKIHAKK